MGPEVAGTRAPAQDKAGKWQPPLTKTSCVPLLSQPGAQGAFQQGQPQRCARGSLEDSRICPLQHLFCSSNRLLNSFFSSLTAGGTWGRLACAPRYRTGACLFLPAPPVPSRKPGGAGPATSADVMEKPCPVSAGRNPENVLVENFPAEGNQPGREPTSRSQRQTQADPGDIAGSVPDHNEASISIMQAAICLLVEGLTFVKDTFVKCIKTRHREFPGGGVA